MSENNFDVIVIGGGPMGLAAAYELSKRKTKTLVLEQFKFKNELGSSAGISRQYRIPYPDTYMVQMALDSQPYWDELQSHTDEQLLDKVGTLWFGDPSVQSTEGNIAEAEKAMDELGVSYTKLTSKEIEDQYHFKNLPESYSGLFQADGASINFKATINTLYKCNDESEYVTLKEHQKVIEIENNTDSFRIETHAGDIFVAKKLVVVPGPYVDSVINLLNFQISATYWNMSSTYFKKLDPSIQYPTWFVFQNAVGKNGNQFYGFPGVMWDHPEYIRVAPDFVMQPLDDPSERTLRPNEEALAYTSQWVADHMTGLDPTPCHSSTCLVALSNIPNKELLIDFAPNYVPNHENIVIYATGWAAKFTPYLGKILSDLSLDGHTDFDITPFKLGPNYFSAF